MNLVVATPPNIEQISAKFGGGIFRLGAIYAYGDTIYNPMNLKIPRSLMAHEAVHSIQQRRLGGPERWWQNYIDDPLFRLAEEVLAHRAEYEALVFDHGDNRANRRRFMTQTARRLCAPIYQFDNLSSEQARRLLTGNG